MSDAVEIWLDKLGLGKYAEVFSKNEIDFRVLPRLSEEDLIALGLPLGARRNLQAAVEELSAEETKPTLTAQSKLREASGEAEHRQLTVMFCDLVGSTELSQKLDPEDMRDVLRAYQDACKEAIERYEGCVARYMGDGLLAYYGYPQAHEDDAERSIHAGLAVVKAMDGLNGSVGKAHNIEFSVRVGIATGPVVVGDIIGAGVAQESAVVGETPNLSARLQSVAQPNTVVLSPTTYRLTSSRFELESKGAYRIKGINDPVVVWRAIREKSRTSEFEDGLTPTLLPFVGRGPELGLLHERWQRSMRGEGQVVLLCGDAGIGKTRIVKEFQNLLQTDSRSRVLYFGSPHHQNTSFYPASDQLTRGFRFTGSDSPAQKIDKIERGLKILGLPVDEIAPLLASLQELPTGDRYPQLKFNPEQLRFELIEAILRVTDAMAKRLPVLQVVEDTHWIDPSTLEFVTRCVERFRHSRIMQIITFRADFEPPWRSGGNVTTLTLSNLSRAESEALVNRMAGGEALSDEVRETILSKTDGVPLFLEELTRSIVESDRFRPGNTSPERNKDPRILTIPETLQDSLRARLDHLADARETVQLAAVIGRQFTHDLLAAVSTLSEPMLDTMLSQLVEAGLIYRRGSRHETIYEFKHALIQEAAYQGLLRAKRSELHARVAHALLERFANLDNAYPEFIARHCSLGGLRDQAVSQWRLAGERAMERSAYLEAIACFKGALAALEDSFDGHELTASDIEQGIDIRLNLRGALNSLGRFREMSEHIRVAAQLAERTDNKQRIAEVNVSEAWALGLLGDLTGAVEAGLRAQQSARDAGDRGMEAAAGLALGWAYWFLGEGRKSIDAHAEHVEYLCKPELRFERFGHAGVRSIFCLSNLSRCHAAVGEFTEALDYGKSACEIAEELGRAYDLVYALGWYGTVLQCKGKLAEAASHLEKALDIQASETLFLYPTIARELALTYAWMDRLDDARTLLEDAMVAGRSMSFSIQQAWVGAYLGLIDLLQGLPQDALANAQRSLRLARDGKFQWIEVFVLRLLGMIGMKSDCLTISEARENLLASVERSTVLELLPEVAHGRSALGELYAKCDQQEDAYNEWTAARDLYRSMGMDYWESRAESVLRNGINSGH